MTRHRQLSYGATIPQDFLDQIQEFISTQISPNAAVVVLNTNTVQIAAGTDNNQVTLGINGRWRYITSAANATHPGGAAATYNLWATSADNSFTIGPPEVDNTVYTFALQILPVGSSPSTALFRQIGTVVWNGSAITDANLLFDDPTVHGGLVPGDLIQSAAASRPGALLCDGSSYLRTAWPALFNALGGTSSPFGFADGTHFNVPDYRGYVLMGTGTGTYSGAVAHALGAVTGEATHLLTGPESGIAAHTHPSGGTITGTTGAGTTATGTTGTSTTGTGTTGTGTSGNDSPDHTHGISVGLTPDASSLAGTGPTPIFIGNGDTGRTTAGASARHNHTIPGLSVPGLTVPGLSIPALAVAGLSISVADPATPANTATTASSAHNNLQPSAAVSIFIKT